MMKYSFIPHMMPMLWMFIFMLSLTFLLILSSLIYFFYLPNIYKNPYNKYIKLHKWNWMW